MMFVSRSPTPAWAMLFLWPIAAALPREMSLIQTGRTHGRSWGAVPSTSGSNEVNYDSSYDRTCKAGYVFIDSAQECETAASALGLRFTGSVSDAAGWYPLCFRTGDDVSFLPMSKAMGFAMVCHEVITTPVPTTAPTMSSTPSATPGAVHTGDTIWFTGHTGKHLTVQGTDLHAKWHDKGVWQEFVIEKMSPESATVESGDAIYLRAHTGKQVSVQDTTVLAQWGNKDTWERLTIKKKGGGAIYPNDTVYLQAHTEKFIAVEGTNVVANGEDMAASEALLLEK